MFVQPPAPFASPAPSADAVSIKQYRINVSNKRLSRLKQKLALSDFPGSLVNTGQMGLTGDG